ncbi:monovalent cation/H(+) antiporter subunit G [Psychrobacillus psychrodurans]|uniref:monovalent cation/H(+) antiporter subunit G n=1 Tax=Psychrobacillus psychrodurans TaxID=126157 RepID=UPI0008E32FE0|nr:monovalent cation/H(+) antiporter subunit G [Psychrobacillus psychrodurans]MCZ8540406.1 monovalent cation/H(+) antiporter subunit G [Psychrobacillus psychrodurans]SFM58895.1 multicomponent Na+:H+ antiporter subunit G [Psychrobacillus psychrodurans]
MTVIANTLIIATITFGTIFILVTAIGLIRLPDAFSRAHAASKSATLGVMSILLGVFLHFWLIEDHFNSRILLGIVFIFITGPVGGHMMGRAAYLSGVKLSDKTVRDDLAEVIKKKREKLK